LNPTTPYVGVVDMGPYLAQMQDGSVNVWLSDNAGVDWATYTVAVATPKADPIGAMVFLDGGNVTVDSPVTPIGGLQNGGPEVPSSLTLQSTGRIAISQDFAQDPSSSLAVEIGGSSAGEFGQLAIGDQALLAGTISLKLVGGYQPAAGTQVAFLTAGGGLLDSRFHNSIVGDLSGNGVWGIEYAADAAIAELLSTTRYGDLTGDGAVNATDWTAFKSGQGQDFAGLSLLDAYLQGDMNGDGTHDLVDFLEFRLAYDGANGTGSFARMLRGVPEPAAGWLMLVGTAALSGTIRRRRTM
jgi:hypothetical protein